jgi:hypothetical protein
VHRDEVAAEAQSGQKREPDSCGDSPLAFLMLPRGKPDADEREGDSRDLQVRGTVAGREADRDG